jgi:hypothetical protein
VQRLIASCLNDACRHQGLIDVSKYPDDVEVPSFARKVSAPSAALGVAISTCGLIGRSSRRGRQRYGMSRTLAVF